MIAEVMKLALNEQAERDAYFGIIKRRDKNRPNLTIEQGFAANELMYCYDNLISVVESFEAKSSILATKWETLLIKIRAAKIEAEKEAMDKNPAIADSEIKQIAESQTLNDEVNSKIEELNNEMVKVCDHAKKIDELHEKYKTAEKEAAHHNLIIFQIVNQAEIKEDKEKIYHIKKLLGINKAKFTRIMNDGVLTHNPKAMNIFMSLVGGKLIQQDGKSIVSKGYFSAIMEKITDLENTLTKS